MTMKVVLPAAMTCALLFLMGPTNSSAQYLNGKLCQQPATNAETHDCFTKAAKEADQRLNRIYAEIQGFLKAQNRTADGDALRKAQQSWIAFRDANCAAAYGLYGGGTGGPVNEEACIEAETRERTEDLKTGYGWLLEKFGQPL